MSFPHPEHKFLLQMKRGQFTLPFVQDYLEEVFEDIEGLERISDLPEKPDHKYWEEWLYLQIKGELCL